MGFELLSCLLIAFLAAINLSFGVDPPESWCEIDTGTDRSGVYDKNMLWKEGIVPYKFDESFSEKDRQTFQQAINQFHTKTCIRWRPHNGEVSHVRVWTDHDPNRTACARASPCETGSMQYIAMTTRCYELSHMVHEMMHVMCFLHEQQRTIRDEWVKFVYCPTDQIPPIYENQYNYGGLYDYLSQTHYQCRVDGCAGFPKMEGVTKCGSDKNKEGLGVLDADKLNHVYNCQGCYGHRWYNPENLTNDDPRWQELANFALSEEEPVYVCRGYVGHGEISTGQFQLSTKVCHLTWNENMYSVNRYYEVFALPNGPTRLSVLPPPAEASGYGLRKYAPNDEAFTFTRVAVGRDKDNTKIYLAVRVGRGSKTNTFVGKAYHGQNFGIFPDPEQMQEFREEDFYLLICYS